MDVDVVSEIVIDRPRAEVAGYAAEPAFAAPLVGGAMRRANRKDLAVLKARLEN